PPSFPTRRSSDLVSWIYFVLPALLLNYMGQGAMILSAAPHEALAKVKDPFFYLAPDMLRLPLVLLATAATIIASQAVSSGAFSVTQQALQLGFVPRLRITHTSAAAAGQVYIPVVNWALMITVIPRERPAADDQPHERGQAAGGDLHQVGGAECDAGAGDGGGHDQLGERCSPRAAAQPEAQQGAPRAGDPPDSTDRGRALCDGRAA